MRRLPSDVLAITLKHHGCVDELTHDSVGHSEHRHLTWSISSGSLVEHEQKCSRPGLSQRIFLDGGKFGVLLGRVPRREKLWLAMLPLRGSVYLACHQEPKGVRHCILCCQQRLCANCGHPACVAIWRLYCWMSRLIHNPHHHEHRVIRTGRSPCVDKQRHEDQQAHQRLDEWRAWPPPPCSRRSRHRPAPVSTACLVSAPPLTLFVGLSAADDGVARARCVAL